MSAIEDLVCRFCGRKPELVRLTGRPGDPVKWRARCNCFFSDEYENPVHAYLDWEARAGEAERRVATALGNAFR
jgi:hypothetical protein